VSGLALGDYALWNWSLDGGHDVLAAISGLSLLPLVLATAWLLALNLARVLARGSRARSRRTRRRSGASARRIVVQPSITALSAGGARDEREGSQTAAATTSSDKLAA
jgi:hypothetical protein